MKNLVVVALGLLILFATSPNSDAEEFNLSLGVKGWYNKLSLKINNPDITIDDNDTQWVAGPTLQMSYGKIFGGIAWLVTPTDYGITVDVHHVSSGVTGTYQVELDRNDVDAIIGYFLHPRFGIYAGYKYLNSDGGKVANGQISLDLKIHGAGFGALFNYAFESIPMVVMANATYLPSLSYRFYQGDVGDQSEDMDGYTAEVTVAYMIGQKFSVSGGYKVQNLEAEGDEWDFAGISVGVDYRF
jgi:hypothetical protein